MKKMYINQPTVSSISRGKKTKIEVSMRTFIDDDVELILGKGEAKCSDTDIYNKDFGYELAYARACINVHKKVEKYLISLTHKPEWKKEKPKESEGEIHKLSGFSSTWINDLVVLTNISPKNYKVTIEEL